MNILTLYYICYTILAMYMLDSGQEPSYNLSKNLWLLPRILKLIEDMEDDSTPLNKDFKIPRIIWTLFAPVLHLLIKNIKGIPGKIWRGHFTVDRSPSLHHHGLVHSYSSDRFIISTTLVLSIPTALTGLNQYYTGTIYYYSSARFIISTTLVLSITTALLGL